MKAIIWLAVIPLLLTGGETDFRKVKWGMTIDEVKKVEYLKLESQIGSQLRYSHTLAGIQFSLIYEFYRGRLSKGTYTSKEVYLDKNHYISDYNSLKGLLIKKYGTPVEDKENWINDEKKNDPEKHGDAVSQSQLEYWAKWKNDRTNINIHLKGINKNCAVVISYAAIDTKWNTQIKDADKAIDDL